MVRILWGLAMIGGSIFNFSYTLFHPEIYNDLADLTLFPIYSDFIEKVIVENPVVFTWSLIVFELITGLLILSKGIYVKVGLVASIIFALALVPGIVPYTYLNILLAIIPVYLLRRKYPETVLHRNHHDIGKSA